MNRSKK